MTAWYADASAIFVGGSLAPVGGHNLLEPARCGKPAVVGPHMHNFQEDLQALQQRRAVFQEDDAVAVMNRLCDLLDSPEHMQAAGTAALEVTSANNKVLQTYTDGISQQLQGLYYQRDQASGK